MRKVTLMENKSIACVLYVEAHVHVQPIKYGSRSSLGLLKIRLWFIPSITAVQYYTYMNVPQSIFKKCIRDMWKNRLKGLNPTKLVIFLYFYLGKARRVQGLFFFFFFDMTGSRRSIQLSIT